MKSTFATVSILAFSAVLGLAALPPGSYDKLKDEASDVLRVKIAKAEVKQAKGGLQDVVYTAEVLSVRRSKSGHKRGDTVQIVSYRLEPGAPPLAGPGVPPQLKAGWKGTAFLNQGKDEKSLKPAAYGQSFVPFRR